MRSDLVLKAPIITEKTVAMKGKYSFLVNQNATKGDVSKAVKDFYKVDVAKVNIVNVPQKFRQGKHGAMRKRGEYKKAIVTLKGDATIDFNTFK